MGFSFLVPLSIFYFDGIHENIQEQGQWLSDGRSGLKPRYYHSYNEESIQEFEKTFEKESQILKTIGSRLIGIFLVAIVCCSAMLYLIRKKRFKYTEYVPLIMSISTVAVAFFVRSFYDNLFTLDASVYNDGYLEFISAGFIIISIFFTGFLVRNKEKRNNGHRKVQVIVLFTLGTFFLLSYLIMLTLALDSTWV